VLGNKAAFEKNLCETIQSRDGQIAARGPNVARHSVLSGPWEHSENIFKSEISSNLSNVSADCSD